jgi:hypothetical protein
MLKTMISLVITSKSVVRLPRLMSLTAPFSRATRPCQLTSSPRPELSIIVTPSQVDDELLVASGERLATCL